MEWLFLYYIVRRIIKVFVGGGPMDSETRVKSQEVSYFNNKEVNRFLLCFPLLNSILI